eukprot:4174304-Alexandrium_andersonii.AAC.1
MRQEGRRERWARAHCYAWIGYVGRLAEGDRGRIGRAREQPAVERGGRRWAVRRWSWQLRRRPSRAA